MGGAFLLAMLAYRCRQSQSPVVRAQARTILWGSLLAFGPVVGWFFVDFIWPRVDFYPVYLLPWLIVFPISVTYAVLRYRLFDVSLVMGRGVAYVLLSGVIVGIYFALLYLLDLVLGVTLPAGDPLLLGLLVLLLALGLNRAWTRLQQAVDRLFLGEAVDRRQIVRRFANRLTESSGMSSILQVLGDALSAGWSLQYAALYLQDPQSLRYVPRSLGLGSPPTVTFISKSPLVHQLLQRRESVYLYQDRPLPAELLLEGESLEPFRSALLVPVPGHGWMALGPKRSGTRFAPGDLPTLQSLGSQLAFALEKERLLSDLERRVAEVDVLRWVGQAVNFAMDVDDLMELIYAQTSRVLDTSNFYIALHNVEKGTLSFAFYVAGGERLFVDDEWPVGVGLAGEIVRTGRAIVTGDYVQECEDRGIAPGGRSALAWMGAPLNAGDLVIGVMNVSSNDPAISYTSEQLRFFSSIADQAAAILDKARLYREMEERARQLAVLNEVGSVVASTLDVGEVLNLIMDKAVQLLVAEAGSLVMVDQDTGELVFEVTAGPGSADLVGVRLPPDTGVVGTVVREREPVTIGDAQSDQRWFRDLDESFITRSIIAVPMISRGRAIGVIELLNRRDGGSFDEEDERLLMAFANDAAIAIENARLFTQTDQALAARVEELSMMQQVDRELNATLDYRRVMEITLDWALRTAGADAGLVAVVVEREDGMRGLRFLASRGYPEELVSASEDDLWPLDRGIIGRVVRAGRPSLVTDIGADPDFVAVLEDIVAQLTVPIRREEQVVGAVALESSRKGQLDDEALDFVARLADHAAIAIENARLFEQVRRANDAKTEFVSFVSHELKQPMTSIRGYTDLLVKGMAGELSEAQHELLGTIRANADRMASLVSELLDISRIESGRIHLNLGDVSLGEVIESVVRGLRAQIEGKQQELEINVPPDLPLVRGDRERLTQVLTNLLSNAYKYTPERGHIAVDARLVLAEEDTGEEDLVLCSVSDSGIGMSVQDQERLFTKYFRSDDPAVRNVPGTGLGLVITKSLIELHGGEITVASELEKGTTFAFTVPLARGGE
jgi:signal transduction histidine kinase